MSGNGGEYADVNGTRLYYEIAGAGQALVFIHGFSLDRRMWDTQFNLFAERFRTLRYDVRGFGRSALPKPGEPYSNSADLRALMAHLHIDSAHLVGITMGGSIATEFAIEHPQNIDTLVTVDASVSGWDWPNGHPIQAAVERTKEAGLAAGKKIWLEHPLFAPANERPVVAAHMKAIIDDYSGWHFTNEFTVTAPEPPAIERLDQITVPTLVILGELDAPDFFEIADRMTADARATVHRIPGVGHMSNMEAPVEFNDILLSFLESR